MWIILRSMQKVPQWQMSRMQGERESIMVQDSQVLSGEGLAYLRRVRQGCERMYDSQQLCRQDLCFPVQ